MLCGRGHTIHVFSAGTQDSNEQVKEDVTVHRVLASNRIEFSERCIEPFRRAHQDLPFDVIESPDIGPEGGRIAAKCREVAYVVKLHSPTALVNSAGFEKPSLLRRWRFFLAGLRRRQWNRLSTQLQYVPQNDPEYHAALLADEIASPSSAIGKCVSDLWSMPAESFNYFPYPFHVTRSYLDIPVATQARTVGFVGRLEARKGIVELAQAIPKVLKSAPHMRFKFIGPSWPYRGQEMSGWILQKLGKHARSLELTGPVDSERIPSELATCDIVVLPSRWESFGFVCAEAMSSGRVVIGSASGGMAEMIEPGKTGLLVPPRSPSLIAKRILSLVQNESLVEVLGRAGRESIQKLLSPERIYPLQISCYESAIQKARQRTQSSLRVEGQI